MKSKRIIICLSLVVFNLIFPFSVVAQDENDQPRQKPELVERFEKVIKNNEPKFTLDKSRFGERLGKAVSSSMRWTLHADKVSLNIAEFDSIEDAKNRYKLHFDAYAQIPVPKTKLTNLGDEAYIKISGRSGKFEFVTIIIRKGNIVLDLRSNKVTAAKRFAQHFADETIKQEINSNNLNKKKLLIVKFEKVIEVKEPNFKGGTTGESGEYPVEFKSSLSWMFAGSKVNVDVSDYISETNAIKYFKLNYTENVISPFRSSGEKLTNLGDEAWIIPINTSFEHSRTQLVLRKGTVQLFIRATSNTLAIRFAEYFVKAIQENN